MPETLFPPRFVWGASTSAYQIEGSPLADGAGPSIWHRFCRTPGKVANGETGEPACDHYHRWKDDVALMKRLGLQGYRFSIAWGRILPEGRGRVNQKGLDFYRRLVDELAASGIEPMATLYHWDLPAALDDLGGWTNRDVVGWFADYAEVLFRALDDRVRWWATINEPWVVMDGGYLHGGLAPGHASPYEAPIVAHNLLLAHGEAVAAYRAIGKNQIGIVLNLEPKDPASDSAEDRDATRLADAQVNRHFLDPLFRGSYPEEMSEIYGDGWPELPRSDFDVIRRPMDFLGINYYTRGVTAADPSVPYIRSRRVPQPGRLRNTLGWEVRPESLTELLVRVHRDYTRLPLFITENGGAFYDPPSPIDGRVEDPLRIHYLRTHLLAAAEAIRGGVDLRGYFVWSLMDNFEWSLGYAQRFGIVHVDYRTQQRTPKQSAEFYSEVIRTGGANLARGA
ncbi:MAG TPA: GH1 family beta-glucosidase [Thermoanaerobaculia bacterium]|nr:GH1 family beta-glucosidase [Thermoanaerobaculia bacterium]